MPQRQSPAEEIEPKTSTNDRSHPLPPSLSRPVSFQGDVEGAKRRSLLPQPGQSKYSSRLDAPSTFSERTIEPKELGQSANESSEQTMSLPVTKEVNSHTATPGRLRPRSMYQTGIAPSERAMLSDEVPSARSMLPPASVNKPSERQTAGLNRAPSLRRPGVVVPSASRSGTAVHSRAHSVSTTADVRRDTVKSNTSSERPKSFLAVPGSNLKTNGDPKDRAPSGTKGSTRIALTTNRSASTRARPDALSGGGSSTATASRAEEPPVSQPRHRDIAREEPKKSSRPAFTTLQQHFTPRKTGKAPTATFLHPAPVPSTNSLPSETVHLQSELLQLHLMHEVSAQVSSSWESGAKRSLHKKFEEVASLYQAMLEFERAGQEQMNIQSVLDWSAGSSSAGLMEHIQILSGPLNELPSLVESGGRVQRLVSEFEHWILWVHQVRSARGESAGGECSSNSIEGLGDSWKAENAALIRKLASFARDLERLDRPSPGSSIACIVDTCESLLTGILDELHIMQMIEAEVVTKEKDWVEDRLRVITRDIGMYSTDTSGESVAWRT